MLHPDFKDLLSVLADERVEYLVIGGYAVSFHARPRFTKDIDLWIRDTKENRESIARALRRFGAPEAIVSGLEGSEPTDIIWFGVPPTRVDVLRRIEGVDFDQAFETRVITEWEGVPVCVIGRDELIAAKRAAGREQDLRDVRELTRRKR